MHVCLNNVRRIFTYFSQTVKNERKVDWNIMNNWTTVISSKRKWYELFHFAEFTFLYDFGFNNVSNACFLTAASSTGVKRVM